MGRFLTSKALEPDANRPAAKPPATGSPASAATPARPVAAPARPAVPVDSQEVNPLRKLSFMLGLGLLFLFVSVLPELLLYITNMNTYLLYLVGPAAIAGALVTGGLQRTLRYRAAWLLLAFFVWMILAIPFSYWKGGSTGAMYYYVRIPLPLLFVVGGGAMTWKELRAVFYTMGVAGIVNLLTARFFNHVDDAGRTSLTATGTIGNSNDLAAHLLFVLPFVLFIAIDSKRSPFLRYPLFLAIGYGVLVIAGTASRGGLLAMGAVFLFVLWRATPAQRVAAVAMVVVLGALIPLLLRGSTMERLGSLFGRETSEAEESADFRKALFRTSVRYTFQHPLFGVGPDQFANYEGNESLHNGERGSWHATHCSWTQVSAECGIPALIFFVSAIGSALLLVNRTWRQARSLGFGEIANACFCYLTAMVGFLVAISFLSNAYRFYFPVIVGLGIAIHLVGQRVMGASQAAKPVLNTRVLSPAYPLAAN